MALRMLALSVVSCALARYAAATQDVDIDTTSGWCGSEGGGTCGSALLQVSGKVAREALDADEQTITCDEASWPDKDHGLVCGECKVLVNRFNSHYQSCSGYCAAVGRECAGAWEEQGDTCTVLHDMTCEQTIASSDAICQCGANLPAAGTSGGGGGGGDDECYGEFTHVVADEGSGVGDKVETQSVSLCKSTCDGSSQCESFAFCPEWNGCWMKGRTLTGSEPTRVFGTCKTYYKKPCSGRSASAETNVPAATQAPPASSGQAAMIRVVSYNIYWWNAFDQNPWKGQHVTTNIRDSLNADVVGLQECDEPGLIQSRTGYSPASPFRGAQGVVVKPNLFTVGATGFQDIGATGKWGPRYATWAQLTHNPSGRTFWHFNTHWCVHSGNGQTCGPDKRFTGARNMLNIIREKAGNAPVIITGDFNAGMGEQGPQHFLQNGFSLAVNHWVDAVFYSTSHWRASWTGNGDAAHSDHRPVIAELELV